MPVQRFRSRRAPVREDPTIEAIREDREIEWSPEAWSVLLDARFFGVYQLTEDEMERVIDLMNEWSDRQHEYDRVQRMKGVQ